MLVFLIPATLLLTCSPRPQTWAVDEVSLNISIKATKVTARLHLSSLDETDLTLERSWGKY